MLTDVVPALFTMTADWVIDAVGIVLAVEPMPTLSTLHEQFVPSQSTSMWYHVPPITVGGVPPVPVVQLGDAHVRQMI